MNAMEYVRSLPRDGWKLDTGLVRAENDKCPLVFGTRYSNWEWWEAAKEKGISYADALSIVDAADGVGCNGWMLEHFGLEKGK